MGGSVNVARWFLILVLMTLGCGGRPSATHSLPIVPPSAACCSPLPPPVPPDISAYRPGVVLIVADGLSFYIDQNGTSGDPAAIPPAWQAGLAAVGPKLGIALNPLSKVVFVFEATRGGSSEDVCRGPGGLCGPFRCPVWTVYVPVDSPGPAVAHQAQHLLWWANRPDDSCMAEIWSGDGKVHPLSRAFRIGHGGPCDPMAGQ